MGIGNSFSRIPVAEGEMKEYLVVHNFQTTEPNELPLYKNEIILATESPYSNWWFGKAKRYGKTFSGKFLKSHVCLPDDPERFNWYFDIERPEAFNLLINVAKADCSFLIRRSKRQEHAYALHIRINDCNCQDGCIIRNIRIHRIGNKYKINQTNHPAFNSLESLVRYYKKHPIGKNIFLSNPCPKDEPVYYELSFSTSKDFSIRKKDIKLGKELGRGEFGVVRLGTYKKSRKVAVKILHPKNNAVELMSEFMAEVATLRQTHHPNIVPLYGTCNEGKCHYIVTEYLSNGSLKDYLDKKYCEEETVSERNKTFFASQIAEGMKYLEDEQLVHRDLAARNVLINEYLICKIGDFGLARFVPDYYLSESNTCPFRWLPLEVLTKQKYSTKSDVWSYAVVLYEVYTIGKVPYFELETADEIIEFLEQRNQLRIPDEIDCQEEIRTLMSKCFSYKADNRPTFDSITETMEVLLMLGDDKNYN